MKGFEPRREMEPEEIEREVMKLIGPTIRADAEARANPTLQRRMYYNSVDAGWDPEDANTFAEEIAHLHEEVAEAFREWRLHKNFETRHDPETGKPLGIPSELADVLIGMFYLAERGGFDLLAAMEEKAAWNTGRDYTAEGRQLHAPTSIRNHPTEGGRTWLT